jgi:hypothetical protein
MELLKVEAVRVGIRGEKVSGRKSEVRRSEVNGERLKGGDQKSEVRSQRSDQTTLGNLQVGKGGLPPPER